jgi:hypothetical protein
MNTISKDETKRMINNALPRAVEGLPVDLKNHLQALMENNQDFQDFIDRLTYEVHWELVQLANKKYKDYV